MGSRISDNAVVPEIDNLFASRKRVAAIAAEMRRPYQTVHSWKRVGRIPPWNRPAVLAAVQRLGYELTPETITYLASVE